MAIFTRRDGEYGLESEEVILTPEDENPLRRILQVQFSVFSPPCLWFIQMHTRWNTQAKLSMLTLPHCMTLDEGIMFVSYSPEEATFNASEVYAPATSSYHCQHVSSLHKYDTLLVPSSHTDTSANWHITFTDFQAFNVQSEKFASASDCATFLTPAILMGLVTSLILLLVLAYALHMVVHLKHIDRYEEHKATVYFPRSPEAELPDKNSL
ncbi:hypothetical protein XENOCAPTIV_001220 [Xenoophorus captivus]|uniref:V-type proton ATPase subunit S1-like protein n=1 Tax=Xenoophorus captivus TaxID=1517983 RepID=A0ABV0RBJ7_9TELE